MMNGEKTPEQVGADLKQTLRRVIDGVPNCKPGPSALARLLGVSRVMISRTLTSIGKDLPGELLIEIPGPETLRSIVLAAKRKGAFKDDVGAALAAIEDFDRMIRDQFGTRAAFNAALGAPAGAARDKFDQNSRYHVYKGMSQVLGVQSKVWITCTMLTPSKNDDQMYDLSSIFGPSGLRRLRPDTPMQLAIGIGPRRGLGKESPRRESIDLNAYCSNPPAPITLIESNNTTIKAFAPDVGTKESVYDMISGVQVLKAIPRAAPPGLTRRGISVIPEVPAAMINLDFLLHDAVFEGITPEAFVYNTRGTGKIEFENPNWELNRMATEDQVEDLGKGFEDLELDDVPGYRKMVDDLVRRSGYPQEEFRMYRFRVQYPIFGFQYVMSFRVLDQAGS